MKSLKQLLEKTTPLSPAQHCKENKLNIKDYNRIDIHYMWSDKTGREVLNDIFKKHPDAEVLSKYSKEPYGSYFCYTGILLELKEA